MEYAEFLHTVAQFAGDCMSLYWKRSGIEFELKPDKTPVTQADTRIGEYLATQFKRCYPNGVCIREETDFPQRLGVGLEGVFDEIDGTAAFAAGRREAVFAGAILEDHIVQNMIIHAPLFGSPLTFTAQVGHGAYCNKSRISVSPQKTGKLNIVVATASPEPSPNERYHAAPLIAKLKAGGFTVEPMYSSSYSCAKLAQGRIHGVIFAWDTIHDMAMGHGLVTEAGGVTSDLYGNPLDFGKNKIPGYIMANNLDVHRRLREVVSKHRCQPTPI